MGITTRQFLKEATLTREVVDRFLDETQHNWAAYDPELGYRLHTCTVRDGLDGSYSVYRYALTGERLMVNYADRPCRLNTYGDSFTQCHQVSDGETWQEYLAAHLGEPIRNFGVGGYGVYQAYRRLRREERTVRACPYVILNLWSDDHTRSLFKWRWLATRDLRRHLAQLGAVGSRCSMFHNTPWAHVRLNPDTGRFEEIENAYATPQSLYLLCDEDHVYETFKDDFHVQTLLAEQHASDVKHAIIGRVAEALGLASDFRTPEATAATARSVFWTCALRASLFILDKARAFARAEGKKLMILLSYPLGWVTTACRGGPRDDQALVDYLKEEGFLFVDTLAKHVADFQAFRCSPEEYVQRYYIGHYSPRGNHFFAFAIKDEVVAWLDPKPPAYREEGPSWQELAATLA